MRSNVSKPCSLLAWQLAALKIRNLQWTGMQLKHIGCTALAALAMALVQTIASPACAQSGASAYPERPVRIVVPFAPGAGTDAMARLVAQKLGEVLGGNFLVDNRAGASGAIGTQHVAQQPPDGYTLLLVASPFTTVAASLPTAGYDPLRQFTPVGMIASGPLVWAANAGLPASSMRELVALAKSKPGALHFGSGGLGSVDHLSFEVLRKQTGVDFLHVPYRGGGPALNDMLGGRVQLMHYETRHCKLNNSKTMGAQHPFAQQVFVQLYCWFCSHSKLWLCCCQVEGIFDMLLI